MFPILCEDLMMLRFSNTTKSSKLYNLLSFNEVQMFIFDGVVFNKNPVKYFYTGKNGDEQKLRRKSLFIPSYVASFFSSNLARIQKNQFWTRDTSYLCD